MSFTARFLYLLGLGLVPMMLGGFVPRFFGVALAYDALLLGLAAYDYFGTIPRCGIQIERSCSRVLSLGVRQEVTLRIHNLSRRSARLQVKDSPPLHFQEVGREAIIKLLPMTVAEHRYQVRPTFRGAFTFGDVFYRMGGALGLTRAQFRVPAPTEVRVYPNIKQLSQTELALAHASMLPGGLKLSRLLGEGTEFESLRDYVRDDDYRTIDWKATARRNRLTTREYETERNQRVVMAIDTGRLMGAKVGDFTKLDYVANAAALLAQIALLKGDLVGLLLFANRVVAYLPPDKGREQLGRIVEALHRVQPVRLESDYSLAFSFLARKNSRRTLMVCFTDLVDAEASRSLLGGMLYLRPRHLPLCVTISDSDLLAAQSQTPAEAADAFRLVAAVELWEDYRNAVHLLERHGALTVNVPANVLTTATINRYLEVKKRGLL
jgi:uncharacterized protein (DUF58 family)